MSTKALREALNRIESVTFREETEARAELAAIEQAAKDLTSEWAGEHPKDSAALNGRYSAQRLLATIAKEGK